MWFFSLVWRTLDRPCRKIKVSDNDDDADVNDTQNADISMKNIMPSNSIFNRRSLSSDWISRCWRSRRLDRNEIIAFVHKLPSTDQRLKPIRVPKTCIEIVVMNELDFVRNNQKRKMRRWHRLRSFHSLSFIINLFRFTHSVEVHSRSHQWLRNILRFISLLLLFMSNGRT